jgi:hypothetical protein
MKMKPLLLSCLGLSVIGALSAQQPASSSDGEKPPLPKPILRRVTDLTPWTLTLRSTDQGSPSRTSAGKTTFIIKSKNVYHIVESQSNGAKLDKWCVDGMLVKLIPNTDKWSISTSGAGFSLSDFPELSWLSADIYAGVQKIAGKDAYVFKTQYIIVDENGQPETFFKTAAVDVATQWPIYSTNGPSTVLYQFGNPVSTPLSIPDKVGTAIARQKEFAHPSRK